MSFYINFESRNLSTVVMLLYMSVASSDDWMRESIRPLPKRLTPGKRISLCNNADRSCNFGDNCMFPHSKAELKAWNLQLADDSEGGFLVMPRAV